MQPFSSDVRFLLLLGSEQKPPAAETQSKYRQDVETDLYHFSTNDLLSLHSAHPRL